MYHTLPKLLLLFLFFSCSTLIVLGQSAIESIGVTYEEGKLTIECKVNKPDASVHKKNSTLTYKKNLITGDVTQPKNIPVTNTNSNTLTFEIPDALLQGASSVEYQISIKIDSGAEVGKSSLQKLNLSFIQNISNNSLKIQEKEGIIKAIEKERDEYKTAAQERKTIIEQAINKFQANQFEVRKIALRTNDKISVYVQLKGSGKVKGVIKCVNTTTCRKPVKDEVITGYGEKHLIEFLGLDKQQAYKITVAILDVTDPLEKKEVLSEEPSGIATTLGDENTVGLTNYNLIMENNQLKAAFDSQTDGFVQVKLEEKKGNNYYDTDITAGGFKQSETGELTGERILRTSTNKVPIEKAKGNTTYRAIISAWNNYGVKTVSDVITDDFSFKPVSFGFSQEKPVEIKTTPLGATFSWKATAIPDSASVTIDYPSKSVSSKPTYVKIDNTDVEVKIPVSDILQMIDATSTKKPATTPATPTTPAPTSDIKPIMIFKMTKDGIPVEQRFTVSFELPSKAEVNSHFGTNPTGADKEVKESLLKLIDVAAKPGEDKKVNWTNILKSGLSFVIKAAPAVVPLLIP
jgi:hypothetical protein